MPSALVIGGGPAGSVAAIKLARAGWAVSLVEQHLFPRQKVCGECLSHLAISSLARLKLRAPFDALQPRPLHRTLLHSRAGRTAALALPQAMYGISRGAFDLMLLDAARSAGASILQPARCEAIDQNTARLRFLHRNQVSEIRADWLILADGKRALGGRRPRATRDIGIKAHFENVAGSPDAIELFAISGGYGGIAPIEDDRWNFAFSVPAHRLREHRGDIAGLFQQLLQENSALAGRMGDAVLVGKWHAAPLPRYPVAMSGHRRSIPIGNAAAALEPVCGEGIGLAMRSAELAADALLNDPNRVHRLSQDFVNLWRTRSRSCRAVAMAVATPAISRWFIEAARFGPLARLGFRAISKSRFHLAG